MSCREWPGSLRSRFTSGSPSARSASTSGPKSLMSSAKDTGQAGDRDTSSYFPLPERSRPDPAEPPAGRGRTFVQQCRGQGCEVTKLKEKGGTGSGRLRGAAVPDLLPGITKQFQPHRRDQQCCWWGAEIKTNHRFLGKSLLLPFKPLGKHYMQQSRAGFSSGMKGEIFPSPK